MSDEKDLRTALAEALLATDSETAWYLDRAKSRVVSVCRGEVSDPHLRAADVEDDELRFVEIPAITEAEIHEWMEDFVEDAAEPTAPAAAACLDHKPGANTRFEERLARRAPEALTAWHRFRHARVLALADTWAAVALAAPAPGEGGEDDRDGESDRTLSDD
jgi:hypothetical protein